MCCYWKSHLNGNNSHSQISFVLHTVCSCMFTTQKRFNCLPPATAWAVRRSNPVVGDIFHTRPHRPWSPPSLLYTGYRVSFSGVKRPGRGVKHPPSSSAEVKERVELYLHSPSGPSWPVIRWALIYFTTTDIGFIL